MAALRVALALVGGGTAGVATWLAFTASSAFLWTAGAYASGLVVAVLGAVFSWTRPGRLLMLAGLGLCVIVGVGLALRPPASWTWMDAVEVAVSLVVVAGAAAWMLRPERGLDVLVTVSLAAWAIVLGVGGLFFDLSRADFATGIVAFPIPLVLACVSLLVWTGREGGG